MAFTDGLRTSMRAMAASRSSTGEISLVPMRRLSSTLDSSSSPSCVLMRSLSSMAAVRPRRRRFFGRKRNTGGGLVTAVLPVEPSLFLTAESSRYNHRPRSPPTATVHASLSPRHLRPHQGPPSLRGAWPGHRPARRLLQPAPCGASHDQRGGAQTAGARQGLVDRLAGKSAQEALRYGAAGGAAGAVPGSGQEPAHHHHRLRGRSEDTLHGLDAGLPEGPFPAGALRVDHGRRQPRHLRPLAALARDLHHGPDRRGGPAWLAPEGP